MCGAHQHAEHQQFPTEIVRRGWMDKKLNDKKCIDNEEMENMGKRKKGKKERNRIKTLLLLRH